MFLSTADDMTRGIDACIERLARTSRAADFAAVEAAIREAAAAPADVRCPLRLAISE